MSSGCVGHALGIELRNLLNDLKRQKKHQRCIQKLHSGKRPREVRKSLWGEALLLSTTSYGLQQGSMAELNFGASPSHTRELPAGSGLGKALRCIDQEAHFARVPRISGVASFGKLIQGSGHVDRVQFSDP